MFPRFVKPKEEAYHCPIDASSSLSQSDKGAIQNLCERVCSFARVCACLYDMQVQSKRREIWNR